MLCWSSSDNSGRKREDAEDSRVPGVLCLVSFIARQVQVYANPAKPCKNPPHHYPHNERAKKF